MDPQLRGEAREGTAELQHTVRPICPHVSTRKDVAGGKLQDDIFRFQRGRLPASRARLGSRRGVAVTHGGSPFVSCIPEGGSSLRPRLPKRILAYGHGTPVIKSTVCQGHRLHRGKRLLDVYKRQT